MKLINIGLIAVFLGIAIAYLNFTFFTGIQPVFTILNITALLMAVGVPFLYRYEKYGRIKKIESMFPRFLSDVTKNINTGMTLPQAMKTVSGGNYGVLTPYVKEMSAKISWGITFEKALIGFAKKTGSKNLKRTIWTIIEAHRSGGTINTVLDAVSEGLKEIEKIRKERLSSIYSQMINGYMIYLVFLAVMIGMSTFLIPSFGWQGSDEGSFYSEFFRNLTVMQGLFAGLAIGKMAEGTLLAGVKHSFILTIIGVSAFLIFA